MLREGGLNMAFLTGIVDWIKSKIDQLFSFFGVYTTKYSELLVYALLIFLASKILKVKLNVGGGKK
jgi:hypothetical protein